MHKKKIVVIHSGGMDSSLCLALTLKEFKNEEIISLSFNYHQRHSPELEQSQKICRDWNVDHAVIDLSCLEQVTVSALIGSDIPIQDGIKEGGRYIAPPNTIVTGRNGLMARLGAIYAEKLGARILSMGIMGIEGSYSGYRDCSRHYMDKMEEILRLDLGDESFTIRTPLVDMTKAETMALADKLGILDYLWENTITCYEGIPKEGCKMCPACKLRNEGLQLFKLNQ